MPDKSEYKNPRILLIEDNKDEAFILIYYLNNHGYIVDWCDSPQNAIKTAYQQKYLLILLDIMLKKENDGFVLCQQFKADPVLEEIPIIMLTARSSRKDRISGLRLGADDYVTKPYSREEILARIEAVLRRKKNYDFHHKYQELLESSDDIVLFLNEQGQIEEVNRKAEILIPELNKTKNPIHLKDIFQEIHANSLSTMFERVLDGREASGKSWKLKNPNIPMKSVDVKFIPLHQGSHIISVGCILRDSSARENIVKTLEKRSKELREKVEHTSEKLQGVQQKLAISEKMAATGQLAAEVAHELRNPLNTINLSVYLLQKTVKSPAHKINEYFEIIKEEIKRAQKTIDRLLEFSKKSSQERRFTSINKTIKQTLFIVQEDLTISNIDVFQNLSSIKQCKVNIDEMKQVFLNLILNAKEAMPDGGNLYISTKMQNDGYVRIDITDTGHGIAKDDLEKIFDPFYTTSSKEATIGLGLSIVQSAIERNKGRITVESAKNEGTTFSIYLPTFDSTEAEETEF
ncbi:MAG: response regulator [Calditrichaeota bacterium]|nr:response regulator [Calditrichota bacterium]